MKLTQLIAKQNQDFSPFRAWLEKAHAHYGDIEVNPADARAKYNAAWHPFRLLETADPDPDPDRSAGRGE